MSVTKAYKTKFERIFSEYRARKVVWAIQSEEDKPQSFCGKIDAIVNQLEPDEKLLIQERYMKVTRISDYKVYSFAFNPPVSAVTYATIRERAFTKLLHAFNEIGIVLNSK